MTAHYAPRGLVGLLTPQANTTVEPEFSILLPPGHAHVAARMCSPAADMDARLVAYLQEAGRTAAQFAGAPLSALALACTGSSYLVGRDEEQRLLAALAAQYQVPAFTAATAIVECLARLGARRIALASPYPEALTQASVGYWTSHGLAVVQIASAAGNVTGKSDAPQTPETPGASDASDASRRPQSPPGPQAHPIYSLDAGTGDRLLDGLGALQDVDAVVMLGTGLPSLAPLLRANRGARGAPVVSSMLCLAWKAVELAAPGVHPLRNWLVGTHWATRLTPT